MLKVVNAVLHSLCGLVAHSFIPLRRLSAWTSRLYHCIRSTAGVEDTLTGVDIQSVSLCGRQVYEGIFQTTTKVFKQIAQKMYWLHKELRRSS